tara:strand:+ start:60 stop:452 length:393 start_codon:yes stop_codon:yes gene_type:complete
MKQYMKERSGADSNVEFQSGKTKKSAPVAKPTPRPKSVGKTYSNPPVNKMSDQQIRAGNYTLRTINPEAKPKKTQSTAPLSGKQKRMEKGRSRLNPFIIYGETKKKKPKKEFRFIKPIYKGPTIKKKLKT